jgi:hypothetical protein
VAVGAEGAAVDDGAGDDDLDGDDVGVVFVVFVVFVGFVVVVVSRAGGGALEEGHLAGAAVVKGIGAGQELRADEPTEHDSDEHGAQRSGHDPPGIAAAVN